MEGYLLEYHLGSDLPRWFGFHELMMLASWGTVGLECALGLGLLLARTRRWLVIPGLLLHGSIFVLLPVSTFSATMFVLYLAYFDADAVHDWIDRISGRRILDG